MMNKEGDDIDTLRYKYAALRQLHKVANNENDRLNQVVIDLKQEIKSLLDKITVLSNENTNTRNMYLKIIAELQAN